MQTTKPNLEEFLRKLFEQYRIENCVATICVATDRFFFPILFIFIVICFLLTDIFIYLFVLLLSDVY